MSAALEARIAGLEARMAALESGGGARAGGQSSGGGAIASDYEMSGQYGDKVINKDPKRWLEQGGAEYAGCKMSECPSDYLLAVADLYDWQADMDEKNGKTYVSKSGKNAGKELPTAPLKRKDAALARGWARRNAQTAPGGPSTSQAAQPRQASGKAAQGAPKDDYDSFGDDSEVPF